MRFLGHCEKIGWGIDVAPLDDWLRTIPFTEWPQSNPPGGELKPAGINDLAWNDFGKHAHEFLSQVHADGLAGRVWKNQMLSVVMPGHSIQSHVDPQPLEWEYRIHFPITTNKLCWLLMDQPYLLEVGCAYRVNTERQHAIVNHGLTPRIHFMIDVLAKGI